MLKLLATDACALECPVDGRVVYRKETIGFEEVQQFVEEVVGILSNKELEIMNVIVVEELDTLKALAFRKDIAGFPPQLEDAIPRARGDAAALQDV